MRFLFIFFVLLTEFRQFTYVGSSVNNQEITEVAREQDDRPLIFTTLGGGMVALDQLTGNVIWKLKDEPVVKVPNQDQNLMPQFLPDPRHGFLYMYGPRAGGRHMLKKLPFTIPELVANAPCRSTDGILYTGKKSDTWYMIDPKTGFREQISGFDKSSIFDKKEFDNTCSLDKKHAIYMARTEYNILMYNSKSNNEKWNITFFDYTSHAMAQDLVNEYGTIHFTSTSNGRVMSFDRTTGDLVWSLDLETPVVAAYLLDRDGLISVPFNSVGDDTMDHIIEDVTTLRHGKGLKNSNMELFPTLYIGEHNHGLYALSSLVDKNTITISTEHNQRLLLEGPNNEGQATGDSPPNLADHAHNINLHFKLKDLRMDQYTNAYLLLGHYKVPELNTNWLPAINKNNLMNVHDASYLNPDYKNTELKLINGKTHSVSSDDAADDDNETKIKEDKGRVVSIGVQTDYEEVSKVLLKMHDVYRYIYTWVNQQENKGLKVALIVLLGLVVTMFWYMQYQAREFQQLSQGGSKTSNTSTSSRNSAVTANFEDLGDGEVKVGKITFHCEQILGKGCEGTFVYKGMFDKRSVAVKRLLPECFTFADREVALLRESDAHPNVVRYFCMEQDKQFRYIALELCAATLQDYVEKKLDFTCNISSIEILQQATIGLAHLHSMDIVHRDVKPHNVLLSLPNLKGEVRAMISDFGLCKKLNIGRTSFSRRSGVTGTDGWIAPEMINGERTTTSVDIFSLGCVFYYVLSKGKHPFGDVLRRQANILSDEYNLDQLDITLEKEHVVLTKILIRAMISALPYERPSSVSVLKYPIFWSKQTVLNFLQDVSDHNEIVLREQQHQCRLEQGAQGVVRGDWRAHVDASVAADLRRRRTYKGQSVADLLRAIRNKKNHYRELDAPTQESLGKVPEGFVTYWISRFPLLVPHTYVQMQDYRHEDILQNYYPIDYVFRRDNIPELLKSDNYECEIDPEMCDPEVNQLFVKSRVYYEPEGMTADNDKDWRAPKAYNRFNRNSPRKYRNGPAKLERNLEGRQFDKQANGNVANDRLASEIHPTAKRKESRDNPVWKLPM